jgi:hypothetical protein
VVAGNSLFITQVTYVRNDPVNATDPLGLLDDCPSTGGWKGEEYVVTAGECSVTGGKGLLPGSRSPHPRSGSSAGEGGGSDGGVEMTAASWFDSRQARVVKELMHLLRVLMRLEEGKPMTSLPKPPQPPYVRPLTPITGPQPPPLPPDLLKIMERWKLPIPIFIFNPNLYDDLCSTLHWSEACGPV